MDRSPATRRTAPDPPPGPAPGVSAAPAVSAARRSPLLVVSVGLAGAAVLAQVSYPLLAGAWLRLCTIATVLLFAAASLTHAAATHGGTAALGVLLVAGGIGLAAEALGVATGVPFGSYGYGTLGPALFGVPLIVPLAWTMMAYPCLLAGRRLGRALPRRLGGRLSTVAVGAWTLTAWDLYLDPQMVAAGHWAWEDPTPALPGVRGVPLTNYAGWLLVAVVMLAALDRALPRRDHGVREAVPATLLTWTWLGSAVGNLVFFGRPAVAGYGVLAMGVTTLPYLRLVLTDRWREGQ